MLIKYRLLFFSLIISLSYKEWSFAGNEQENPVPLERILAPLGDCPRIPLFLENQDLQKDSPFFIIPKYVKALIFYHLDYKSTLNAMYVCKMFANIIGMACNNLSHNWKNSPNQNTLIKHAFHPASMISLFGDISKGVPPRFINWQEKENLQEEEKHISEQASDLFKLVKDSQDLKFLLLRYLLGLDPAIHFRQVSLGAYFLEKFPELQEYLSSIHQNHPNIDLGDIGLLDSSFDPILKSHLMSLKLLALIGKSNSKTTLNELFGDLKLGSFYYLGNNSYHYKYNSLEKSGSKLPPSWFCYLDKTLLVNYDRVIGLLTYKQGEVFTLYFSEYIKIYLNKNLDSIDSFELLQLRFWYIFFNVNDNLAQIDDRILSKYVEENFDNLGYSHCIILLRMFTLKPSPFYSNLIQIFEEKLKSFSEKDGDFLKTYIIIFILTLGDEIHFDKAEKYIKELLLKFGPKIKRITYEGNVGRYILLAEILDLRAILAIYKGNFKEAENFLRTVTYKSNNHFDFDASERKMLEGFISKIQNTLGNSFLCKDHNRYKYCLYILALVKALKSQMHHPNLSKKLIKSAANILKSAYNKDFFHPYYFDIKILWQHSTFLDEEFIKTIFKYDPKTCSHLLKEIKNIKPLINTGEQ